MEWIVPSIIYGVFAVAWLIAMITCTVASHHSMNRNIRYGKNDPDYKRALADRTDYARGVLLTPVWLLVVLYYLIRWVIYLIRIVFTAAFPPSEKTKKKRKEREDELAQARLYPAEC